jgi:hypothetical protein
MVDSAAGVCGWRVTAETRANRRQRTPPDGAGVAESTIWLAPVNGALLQA